jgi:hypothetical protein
MNKMTIEQFKKLKTVGKTSKYRAIKCIVDGIKFDSKKEATRYTHLKIMEKAGMITDLKLQPTFELSSCKYKADFAYYQNEKFIVEDVKGVKTPIYRLKKKMMLNELGIEIKET